MRLSPFKSGLRAEHIFQDQIHEASTGRVDPVVLVRQLCRTLAGSPVLRGNGRLNDVRLTERTLVGRLRQRPNPECHPLRALHAKQSFRAHRRPSRVGAKPRVIRTLVQTAVDVAR